MKNQYFCGGIILATVMLFSQSGISAENSPESPAPAHKEHAGMHGKHGDHSGKEGIADIPGGEKMPGRPAAWTAYPTLKIRMEINDDTDQREVTVVPQNIVADNIDAYSTEDNNSGGKLHLPFSMAGAKMDKSASKGFYWLAAREEKPDSVHVASTVYFSGFGKDPTRMFMQNKNELEIIPQPFPHEHSRYRANEDWSFIVRFNGQLLPGQKLNLETQNGTKAELTSNAQGLVTVHIPDDFKVAADQGFEKNNAGGHTHNAGRRGSEFVLVAEHIGGGKSYVTGFNSTYGTNAYDQRSLAMGIGFILLGMMGAAPLLRRRESNNSASNTRPGDRNSAITKNTAGGEA